MSNISGLKSRMDHFTLVIDRRILDWLAVFGYLSLLFFVVWQVLNTKKKSDND